MASAPLPVTANTVKLISAALKAGGYRAPEQYFARARREHRRATGRDVDADVEQAFADCARSITRGAGPTAFKDAFRFESLAEVADLPKLDHLPEQPAQSSGDVLAPFALAVLGGWWLAREIECSFAESHDITLDTARLEVSWALPVSKTDLRALGAVRTHGCLCAGGKSRLQRMCPFHFAQKYLDLLVAYFGDDALDPARRLPLFPTAAGDVISKKAAVDAICLVAASVGEAPTRPDGLGVQRPRFGGHTLRVAGAQALARAGVEHHLIELIGRWGSAAIHRYIQEAGLAVQPLIAAKLSAQATSSSSSSAGPPPGMAALTPPEPAAPKAGAFAALEDRLRSLEASLAANGHALSTAPLPSMRFVINDVSKCIHLVGICGPEIPREAWLTGGCSWSFGLRRHTLLAELPEDTQQRRRSMCSTCFPGARKPAASRSSSPASSASPPTSASEASSDQAV